MDRSDRLHCKARITLPFLPQPGSPHRPPSRARTLSRGTVSETPPPSSPIDPATLSIPLRAAEAILGVTVAVARERHARLTPREQQVAALIATGMSNREIAVELKLSIKTVEIHNNHIKIKLYAHTPVEVANLVNLVRL